ncbi:hypothetical protein [Clostridium sporogenes]|uniref:hypothetical protein n=1 Tax=Clostridium sporogenes TaxID=1509 RepID=UPI0009341163|nr:hypothetical protein [Clostridium sporogenes]
MNNRCKTLCIPVCGRCTCPRGITGPTGPQGVTGATGLKGITGPGVTPTYFNAVTNGGSQDVPS